MDCKGLIFHYNKTFYSILVRVVSTVVMTVICKLQGVKINKTATFSGVSHFYRKPLSTIIVGKASTFLSAPSSNLIGIDRPCRISTLDINAQIIIGDNCGFSGTVIGAFSSVIIGNNVRCGANTLITDGDWHHDDYRSGPPIPVELKDNVWLGEGVKVLKGVTIGENTVIGAGSVVTKNIPANVIASGNPCIVIREINARTRI